MKKRQKKIRLGYACLHTGLREKGIFCSRTARSATIRTEGISWAEGLFERNLADLLIILQKNEKQGIRFYRISSEIAPHLTNPEFISKSQCKDPTVLAYDIRKFKEQLEAVGDYAKRHGHRLTFHPSQFVVLGSPNPITVQNSARELYMHALILDLMKLDYNSIIIVHGGGVYGDKPAAIKRWAENFAALPLCVKRRLVVENDEFSFSAPDVLEISRSLPAFSGCGSLYRIPIVFDLFHYDCMQLYNKRVGIPLQPPIKTFIKDIIKSWSGRTIKMHISEQGRGALGHHANMVKTIPNWILFFPIPIDLMIEAKSKEVATLYLMKKYKIGFYA